MKIDETNFVKQIKTRNTDALDYVVDNYSNLVFKVIHRVLNLGFKIQDVEECANDVFWSVWTNIDSFDEERGKFKSWICAIAKYKAVDYRRKLYKQSTEECIEDYVFCDQAGIENLIISKENGKEILQAINEMKDEDREIFIRRYFLSEGIENIAKFFGVNRNLVDQRLSRGRRFLKERLMILKGDLL